MLSEKSPKLQPCGTIQIRLLLLLLLFILCLPAQSLHAEIQLLWLEWLLLVVKRKETALPRCIATEMCCNSQVVSTSVAVEVRMPMSSLTSVACWFQA